MGPWQLPEFPASCDDSTCKETQRALLDQIPMAFAESIWSSAVCPVICEILELKDVKRTCQKIAKGNWHFGFPSLVVMCYLLETCQTWQRNCNTPRTECICMGTSWVWSARIHTADNLNSFNTSGKGMQAAWCSECCMTFTESTAIHFCRFLNGKLDCLRIWSMWQVVCREAGSQVDNDLHEREQNESTQHFYNFDWTKRPPLPSW